MSKLIQGKLSDKVDFQSVLGELGIKDKDIYKFEKFGIDFSIEGDILDILEKAILKHLSSSNALKDAQKQDMKDYIRFILISLVDSIDKMCLELIKSMNKGDGAIVLMMDITNGQEDDKALFVKQAKETAVQVLKYPGKIFPFYALNPKRDDHYNLMQSFFKDYPFVGVKLYPSLGYKIDSEEIDKVVAFCDKKNIPILQHCNHGGFYADKEYIEYSNPKYWEKHLEKYKKFKICFGHFGGDENFTNGNVQLQNSWSKKILDLMETYKGRVYADISFHTDCMDSKQKQNNYFKNLKSLLDDNRYSSYILWGSDFFLINSRITNEHYRIYFQKFLTENGYFEKIAKENPKNYLEIENVGGNFQTYLDFIDKNKDHTGEPLKWVTDHLNISSLGGKWTKNNIAHTSLYKFLTQEDYFATVSHVVAKDFNKVGKLTLDRLRYHSSIGSSAMDDEDRLIFAENLFEYFYGIAELEKSYNINKAINELNSFLKNEKQMICDLGQKIDEIFYFKEER